MTFPDALIGVVFAFLVAGLLAVFQYIISKKLESGQWQREHREKEIESIENAAAKLTEHAAQIVSLTYDGHLQEFKRERGHLRSSFAQWEILVYPHCTSEERKSIQENRTTLFTEKRIRTMDPIIAAVEITHSVKESIAGGDRLSSIYRQSWFQFWRPKRPPDKEE